MHIHTHTRIQLSLYGDRACGNPNSKVTQQQSGYGPHVSIFKLNLRMLYLQCWAFRKLNGKVAQITRSASFDIRATWTVEPSKCIKQSNASRLASSAKAVESSNSST